MCGGQGKGQSRAAALPSVCLMMFSSSSGYLVSRCISEMMRSRSCSRRHWGWLSASYTPGDTDGGYEPVAGRWPVRPRAKVGVNRLMVVATCSFNMQGEGQEGHSLGPEGARLDEPGTAG